MRITVTSTAARVETATVARCIGSVQMQSFANRRHVYFLADAGSADLARLAGLSDPSTEIRPGVYPNAPELANLWPLWRSLPDDEIVVWLDGDDYLATPYALEIVARAHAEGALATYGQFMWADGSIGFAAPVKGDPRKDPWRATHLKTFRAGLVKRIREADLRTPDGAWNFVTDRPVMFPVLELAGHHATFIPNILCVYSVRNLSAERARHDPEYASRQRAEVARLQALPGYAPLSLAEYAEIIGAGRRSAPGPC